MIERKKYEITPLSALGKEKYISGAADFGGAVQHGHGFHTRPFSALMQYIKCSNRFSQN